MVCLWILMINEIADALLKLVSEKNLWHGCRKKGWKNIHLFSWPEHCRTYLTRVAACQMWHPQWQTDIPGDGMAVEESSINDSSKDVQDMTLRLSIDGDKSSLNESLDYSAAAAGEPSLQDQVNQVLSRIRKPESGPRDTESGKVEPGVSKYLLLRRRRRSSVVALDCYGTEGTPERKMIQIVQDVIKAIRSDSLFARVSGLALSTAMQLSETVEFLTTARIQINDLDV